MAAEDPADRTGRRGPRVFVSYAHDDERHKDAVRGLAEFLTVRGIMVDLDMWYGGSRQDWAAWASACLTRADYVLVVASVQYAKVGDGDTGGDDHRGARYEAAFLRDRLYGDERTWRRKVLPVVLPGHAITELPAFLHPYTHTRFIVPRIDDTGMDELLRHVTKQPRDRRPPLGPVPLLPPIQGIETTVVFADAIERLARMSSVVAEVKATEQEARQWPADGEPHIADAPPVTDSASDLWLRITMLVAAARSAPTDGRLPDRLRARESAADDALRAARDIRDRRQASWDEWRELRRDLRTEHARTVPALAEDVELTGLYDRARGCLWRDPCDLAMTRAAVDAYTRAVRRRLGIQGEGDSP